MNGTCAHCGQPYDQHERYLSAPGTTLMSCPTWNTHRRREIEAGRPDPGPKRGEG